MPDKVSATDTRRVSAAGDGTTTGARDLATSLLTAGAGVGGASEADAAATATTALTTSLPGAATATRPTPRLGCTWLLDGTKENAEEDALSANAMDRC